jgi:hypothetical protein
VVRIRVPAGLRTRYQGARGLEDAVQLAQVAIAIGQVFDAFDREHDIERPVVERQTRVQIGIVVVGAEERGAGAVDVDAVRVVAGGAERRGERAVAAGSIENPRAARQPEGVERAQRGALDDRQSVTQDRLARSGGFGRSTWTSSAPGGCR